MAILIIHHIGRSQIEPTQPINDTNWYKYEYRRSLSNGSTNSSFSNDIKELYDMLNKEIKEAINE